MLESRFDSTAGKSMCSKKSRYAWFLKDYLDFSGLHQQIPELKNKTCFLLTSNVLVFKITRSAFLRHLQFFKNNSPYDS